jgi:hypothetical protein
MGGHHQNIGLPQLLGFCPSATHSWKFLSAQFVSLRLTQRSHQNEFFADRFMAAILIGWITLELIPRSIKWKLLACVEERNVGVLQAKENYFVVPINQPTN